MSQGKYQAFVVREQPDGRFHRGIEHLDVAGLPEHDVLIRVRFSSLNYKDALSAIGHRGITRRYPHTPGIDAAGEVVESRDARFRTGDKVIVTGYDLGMNTPGGFGQFIRVPGDWIVRCPDELNLEESMAFGTAGFTAALSVMRISQCGISPDAGEALVTGATGGVGSFAVMFLAKQGFRVTAATGKPDAETYLKRLGAAEIIHRDELADTFRKPLLKSRWSAVVDTVGGGILATAIKSTKQNGAVASCGMVASPEFAITVFPFILRGVSLLGVDSAECPMGIRQDVWKRIAGEWKPENLTTVYSICTLDELDEKIDAMLEGKHIGRIVLKLT